MRLLVIALIGICWLAGSPIFAKTFQGGVEHSEVLPILNLQLLEAKVDKSELPFKQNCVCLDGKQVVAVNSEGRWRVVDGKRWLIDFGDKYEAAVQAVDTIKYYGFTEMCTFGTGGTSSLSQYFLVSGQSPVGPAIANEDALPLHIELVKAENIGGRWKVTAGNEWLLDFDKNQESAEQAAAILKHYDFKYSCYVGRPNSPMSYYRK